MAEQLDLTTPETKPTNSFYKVERISFDWPAKIISISLVGQNGEAKSHSYTGTTAQTLMIALNKVDLSVLSLHKRILNRLITDGVISGTVSGVPD